MEHALAPAEIAADVERAARFATPWFSGAPPCRCAWCVARLTVSPPP